ncbi:MAG: BatA domain-containing protein, partial [Hyphomicrobium sp.]
MTIGALAFLSPWLLAALATLPIIYWLLRAVPPSPATVEFPPTRILVGLENEEKTADKTPWWLTLLRLLAAAFVIFALADPVLNPAKEASLKGAGPVVIVVDNGWGAASRWTIRTRMVDRLIGEAEGQSRAVMVVPTAFKARGIAPKIEPPGDARTTAAAMEPLPFAPERKHALEHITKALAAANSTGVSIIWLHDGIDHAKDAADTAAALAKLADSGSFAVIDETKGEEALGVAAQLGEKGKLEAVMMSPSGTARTGPVHAFSARGERLGEATYTIKAGETRTVVPFELPLELRNQVARIEIPGERSSGAVSLIDAATQWHRVGLLSGESREQAQPLLAPLYYIQKALLPYAELVIAKDANLAASIDSSLKQNASVLMLADIGTISGESAKQVETFVKRGGVLVRFAGPRLEKGGDDLLPVPVRSGGRSLGGALSWSTPQKLTAFEETSPFAGLTIPPDVTIKRQVLADPSKLGNDVEIWARLADGTPLVTSVRRGEGRLVLFHITANSDWSNLPISGLFVEMLRRISTMGRVGAGAAGGDTGDGSGDASGAAAGDKPADAMVFLPPLRTLDGFGALKPPPPTAEPIKASET